jgi:hypothetical protein
MLVIVVDLFEVVLFEIQPFSWSVHGQLKPCHLVEDINFARNLVCGHPETTRLVCGHPETTKLSLWSSLNHQFNGSLHLLLFSLLMYYIYIIDVHIN